MQFLLAFKDQMESLRRDGILDFGPKVMQIDLKPGDRVQIKDPFGSERIVAVIGRFVRSVANPLMAEITIRLRPWSLAWIVCKARSLF